MDKNKLPGDGVVTGHGTIDGRQVFVFAQDFTVFAGSVGKMHAQKICKVIRHGGQDRLRRSSAYTIPAAPASRKGRSRWQGFGEMFFRYSLASGVVPQIAMVMGPCAGRRDFAPGLTDFVFMVKDKSHMFLVGPDVIKAVQNEDVTFEELGGAMSHATQSGTAHFAWPRTTWTASRRSKKLMCYLPSNNLDSAPHVKGKDDPERREESLDTIVPEDPTKPYEMREVMQARWWTTASCSRCRRTSPGTSSSASPAWTA